MQNAPQRSSSRPWDERVGPDASLVNVNKGKRLMAETTHKYASNLPLPPKDSPFLVEMPKRRYLVPYSSHPYSCMEDSRGKEEEEEEEEERGTTDGRVSKKGGPARVEAPGSANGAAKKYSSSFVDGPIVDTDLHMWRAYRSAINGDSARVEGKKMIHSSVKPASEVQNELRKGLRDRLRMQEIKELTLKEEHMKAREEMTKRQAERGRLEDSVWRQRADDKGFEGLKRSTLQQPAPTLPPIDDKAVDELRGSLNPQMLHRKGGKRMVVNAHPSQVDQGPLFGGKGVQYGDALHQRWADKSML